MEFTFLSLPFFFLTLVFLVYKPEYLIYLFVFFMPFTASALVNFPQVTFGLQPSYFLGLLLVGFCTANQLLGHHKLTFSRLNYPLIFFGLWAIVSLTFPVIFENQCLVYSPEGNRHSLQFSRLNITQLAYLLFLIVIILYQTHLFSRYPVLMENSLKVFLYSGLIVILWGWVQFASLIFHFPYPDWLFNNSMSWDQLWSRCLGTAPRICSVFPEPSMYNHFMAAYLPILFFAGLRNPPEKKEKRLMLIYRLFFFLGLLQVMASTSASGYVAIALLFFFILKNELNASSLYRLKISHVLTRFVCVLGFTLFCTIVAAFLCIDSSTLNFMVGEAIINKATSYSGTERLWMTRMALTALTSTSFFGAGWGSLRSTDLGSNLLGQTGIIGFSLLLYWFWIVRRKARQTLEIMEKNQYPSYNLYYGAYLGWITCLIINMVSVPDIVFLYLAFLWAIFVALTPQPVILKTGPSFDHHLILGTSV